MPKKILMRFWNLPDFADTAYSVSDQRFGFLKGKHLCLGAELFFIFCIADPDVSGRNNQYDPVFYMEGQCCFDGMSQVIRRYVRVVRLEFAA